MDNTDNKKSKQSVTSRNKSARKQTESPGPIGATPPVSSSVNSNGINEDSLFNMLNQVNQMLKQNPDMVKKVSSCVNNIFENKNLMQSLVSEIEENIKVPDANDNETDDVKDVPVVPGMPGIVDSVISELKLKDDKEFFQQFHTLVNNSEEVIDLATSKDLKE